MIDPDFEREIMMYLPAVAGWIEKGEDITEADVKNLKKVVPDHLEFGLTTKFEEVVKMNEKYVGDPALKEYVQILLSDRGKAWLKRNMNLLKKFSDE